MKTREEIHEWSIGWMIRRKDEDEEFARVVNYEPLPLESLPPLTNSLDKWTLWWIQYKFRGEKDKRALLKYVRDHFTIKYESYADILSLGTRKSYFTKSKEIVPETIGEIYDFFPKREERKLDKTHPDEAGGILSHGFAHLRGSYPVDHLRGLKSEEERKEWIDKYGIKKRPKESMFWKS